MLQKCLEAAAELDKEGVQAEVIDLRTLAPLDDATILDSVRRTSKLVIVHEDTQTGGLGAEIAARVCEMAFEHLDGPGAPRRGERCARCAVQWPAGRTRSCRKQPTFCAPAGAGGVLDLHDDSPQSAGIRGEKKRWPRPT
jgi:hypothetical protein